MAKVVNLMGKGITSPLAEVSEQPIFRASLDFLHQTYLQLWIWMVNPFLNNSLRDLKIIDNIEFHTESKTKGVFMFCSLIFIWLSVGPASLANASGAYFPSPSPDGKYIAFSRYGDIWVVPAAGGVARRLTDSEGYDAYPMWSPDGKWIAFVSDRYKSGDIFVMPSDGSSPPKRLTYHSAWDRIQFWNERGDSIYFTSYRTEFRGALFRISINGGNPAKVVDFEMSSVAPVPGTDTVFFVRGWTEWWRKKYRGSANWDIWKMSLKDGHPKKITNFQGRDGWPLYSTVTKKIYFVSNDESDSVSNLWKMDPDGKNRERLTQFKEEVYYPAISHNGSLITFEVMGNIYTYTLPEGKQKKVPIKTPQDYKTSDKMWKTLKENATEFALSPDEKELAFVVFGDIYVMQLKKGKPGKIKRITKTAEPEKDISWNPKEEEILFVSLRDGDWDIFRVRPMKYKKFYKDYSFKVDKVLDTPETEKKPRYSPDGKKIAFIKNQGTLYIMDKNGKNLKRLCDRNDVLWIDWSPDSRWIAFSRTEMSWREDVYVVPVDRKTEPFNISMHANDDYKPMWSSDGRRITFASRNPQGDLWIKYVFLRKEDEERDRDYWEEMQDSLKLEEPIKIDFDGIKDRIHMVAKFRGRYNYWTQSKKGTEYAIVVEDVNGNKDIWSVNWFGEDIKRLTKGNTDPKMFLFSNDGKKVYYLTQKGEVKRVEIPSLKKEVLPFKVSFEISCRDLNRVLFDEAWWILEDGFYDPHFHGIDWRKMYDKYLRFALDARTDGDFHNIIRRMIGELDASHLDIWKENKEKYTGCLGIEYDLTYQGEGILVKRVIPKSPADLKLHLKKGDVILAINGEKIKTGTNFYSYLERKSGEKVMITYLKGGKNRKESEVKLISPWELWKIIYKNWVRGNREFVEKKSNGKFGYIHIRAMGNKDLKKFYRDIYSNRDKEGLVLDIRYNGGGEIHDELLNFLRRTVYGYSIERGDTEKVYNSTFRWNKPIVLLINRNCYSDAEIFPMGFKELKLGKVVGTPTFGAVIGTEDITLMDGKTVFREPSEGWYRLNGLSLENHAVKPDVYQDNPPEFDNRSGGPQLEKAIEVLSGM